MSTCDELMSLERAGASVMVASRDAACRPSLGVGLALRLLPDGRLSVVVDAVHDAPLLADLRASGAIAVVATRPSTHRSLQAKGLDATVEPVDASDLNAVAAHARALSADLARVGFGGPFSSRLSAHRTEDLVAVRFTPGEAFEQTPGPDAGAPLRAAGGGGSR